MSWETLLVANRGEIACRIITAARALGLRTVAVHSDADRGAPHVRMADTAVHLGPTPPRESYLHVERVLDAAARTGAGAVHPGYGFLSEDAGFARAVEAAGMAFVGPTPAQLEVFGTKHTARAAAVAAGVPVAVGSELLDDVDAAREAAQRTGYPLILKATGGGGGIGMAVVRSPAELAGAFEQVARRAAASFASSGVFVERYVEHARHVEVQVFGDGAGRVVSLGDRDCTLQRRHQKVLEEAPAPDLPPAVREELARSSRALAAAVGYRSAGTVEFVYDAARGEAAFLEVNTRLQVEHPVTEQVTGVDLVGWMLRLARGEAVLDGVPDAVPVRGSAVEARLYAEDPSRGGAPTAGLLTQVVLPGAGGPALAGVRVDGWVATGTEVSPAYDPLLAKVIATGADRDAALDLLGTALRASRVDGTTTNLGLLRAVVDDADLRAVAHTTSSLDGVGDPEPRLDVERPGLMTTVQDWPGRLGLWHVGVPPSGPVDDLSFRLGNAALGNPEGAPGLECTATGPALRTSHPLRVCVTGAPVVVLVDGEPAAMWEPLDLPAGALLDVGAVEPGRGLRTYLLVEGGLDVPLHLGSAATFTLGQFGGHAGRALRTGDVLRPASAVAAAEAGPVPEELRPAFTGSWDLHVTVGPHPAPGFLTADGLRELLEATWTVHLQSSRTGIRLVGPAPGWARPDGGEAGLHPSNIHDTPYAVGALDLTGDTPILLGPDGPSLGGFVCPVSVVSGQLWALGQLAPGDVVRLVAVDAATAPGPARLGPERGASGRPSGVRALAPADAARDDGVLWRRPAAAGAPETTHRRGGDDTVLVEYGPMVLDLGLRARVHALQERLHQLVADGLRGVVDLTAGVRSLQVHVDPAVLPLGRLTGLLREVEASLPASSDLVVPSRAVRLPLSWDDPATREATARYAAGVRDDAPWLPWNLEFIRRVNGLDDVDAVHAVVHAAEYLVLGLGDVYLGAPVATPLDPRHRLVTTKYNPARTWTAENSVGIGGAYLCVYGMEGPGGYQFVGRTTQVWSRWHPWPGQDASPWLLRPFDRISWYPVGAEELLDLRADVAAGRGRVDVEPGAFSLAEHEAFLEREAPSIAAARERQRAAFGGERERWEASGELARAAALADAGAGPASGGAGSAAGERPDVPVGGHLVEAPFAASVWRVDVVPGARVRAGQVLVALEAMKMETVVTAPADGVVASVLVGPGAQVVGGSPLVVLAGAREAAA